MDAVSRSNSIRKLLNEFNQLHGRRMAFVEMDSALAVEDLHEVNVLRHAAGLSGGAGSNPTAAIMFVHHNILH